MEVQLFPDSVTEAWSLINLLLLLAFPAGLGYAIYLLTSLNRRVRQLEERISREKE